MTTRTLPREEFGRLVGTELEAVAPILPPAATVLVVEDAGQIVGCWALFPVWHAEGLWIAPAHRGKGGVARRLLAGLRTAAHAQGARAVATAATDERVESMLDRLGAVALPGVHFSMGV